MKNLKKFIKYNNLFIIILGLILMVVLPLKIEIPWVSAAVRTGLGRAIVLIVPENVSVEEFLARLGLSESGDFRKPKASSRIVPQEQRNTAPENIVLWLKDKDEDGFLDTQDFSRYVQEINENGEFLEITNDAMLFPTAYIGIEIWLREASSGILLKAGESYQIEIQGSTLYFKLNGESVGSLTVPFDGKAHQVILSFDGINVHLGLDGEEQQQFTPSFATLSRSIENLLVNPHLESLRIFSQPMGEEGFRDAYNELASNFGRENLEPACEPTEEVCDGIDNDCDGLVDEDLFQQCGSSDIGACSFGVKTCQMGIWSECQGVIEPVEEICDDGIDNDCDGIVDNPSLCQTGPGASTGPETDTEATTTPGSVTTTEATIPQATTTEATATQTPSTEATTSQATSTEATSAEATGTESTCQSQTFYLDSDGDSYGDLANTTSTCQQPANYVTDNIDCNDSDSTINPSATETCDGIDNNCNGEVDENLFQQCGSTDIGACQFGTQTCSAGVWSECQGAIEPTEEICGDNLDNNCDGQVDENCQVATTTPSADSTSSPQASSGQATTTATTTQ